MSPRLKLSYPTRSHGCSSKTSLVLQMLSMHQLTFAHRTRALQCLLYLADKETIESLFKKSIEEVK